MAVGGMHIRHDFATWVDWEQKSVRSVCGVTTKRHLAGIPGITPQPEIVYSKTKTHWGWCTRCVFSAWSAIKNNANDFPIDGRVKSLYSDARDTIAKQYEQEQRAIAERRERRRQENRV